jgi:hypothetical protein
MMKNKSNLLLTLLLTVFLSVFLTGFRSISMETMSPDIGQIGQDATPPPPPEPVEPAPEQPAPGGETGGGNDKIIIQLPGEQDTTTSTQYFGAGLTVGCLVGLLALVLVVIGLLVGRSSKTKQPSNTPTDYQ